MFATLACSGPHRGFDHAKTATIKLQAAGVGLPTAAKLPLHYEK